MLNLPKILLSLYISEICTGLVYNDSAPTYETLAVGFVIERYKHLRIINLGGYKSTAGEVPFSLANDDQPSAVQVIYAFCLMTQGAKMYSGYFVVRGKSHPNHGVMDINYYTPGGSAGRLSGEASVYGQAIYTV